MDTLKKSAEQKKRRHVQKPVFKFSLISSLQKNIVNYNKYSVPSFFEKQSAKPNIPKKKLKRPYIADQAKYFARRL